MFLNRNHNTQLPQLSLETWIVLLSNFAHKIVDDFFLLGTEYSKVRMQSGYPRIEEKKFVKTKNLIDFKLQEILFLAIKLQTAVDQNIDSGKLDLLEAEFEICKLAYTISCKPQNKVNNYA